MPINADAPPTPNGAEDTAPDFPAAPRTLVIGSVEFAAGGWQTTRFTLTNPHHGVLHVRLTPGVTWMVTSPVEVALGPGEQQGVVVRTDTTRAKTAFANATTAPVAPINLSYQRLFPGGRGVAPSPVGNGAVFLRLPLATCPSCGKIVDDDTRDGIPDLCPFCFERLRPCPVCGAPNSWLARHCILDPTHVVRAAPDWETLGGGPAHTGHRDDTTRVRAALARRWSFPSVVPARREAALAWSAPVAAYGMVAAGGATTDGESHLYAFDTIQGAPLWEPYPLNSPLYPERGGAALSGGHLFAATVEGECLCIDALRGTRIWETALGKNVRVYGAVVPVPERNLLLVPAATTEGNTGTLFLLDLATGALRSSVTLPGPLDCAPAADTDRLYTHDDSGALTAIDAATGTILWTTPCGAGFDAAPLIRDNRIFSATSGTGVALCHDATTGEKLWDLAVTNAPFSGTPAHDGTLLYLPADDGLHLVSANAGRSVRRFPLRRPVRAAPVVLGTTVFFGATDGTIYAAEAGRPLETAYQTGNIGSQIVAAPAVADGALFVTATNGVLYALNVG